MQLRATHAMHVTHATNTTIKQIMLLKFHENGLIYRPSCSKPNIALHNILHICITIKGNTHVASQDVLCPLLLQDGGGGGWVVVVETL